MIQYLLDTNGLLRYLLNDIQTQADEITRVFEQVQLGKAEVTIPLIVFIEASYVLIKSYGNTQQSVRESYEKFFAFPNVDIPDRSLLRNAFRTSATTSAVSITDALLLHMAISEDKILLTFDKKLQKLAKSIQKTYDTKS